MHLVQGVNTAKRTRGGPGRTVSNVIPKQVVAAPVPPTPTVLAPSRPHESDLP